MKLSIFSESLKIKEIMNVKQIFDKGIFITNVTFYSIILIIPIYDRDITSGLYGQFLLGIFQILIGIYFIVLVTNRKKQFKQNVIYYWVIVALYFSSLFIISKVNLDKSLYVKIFIVIIPMCIGAYNLYVNYLIQKK